MGKHSPTAEPSADGPMIRLQNLTKLYQMGDSTVHALDGVDLQVAQGEFLAITGASGSGKSTMMHILGCLDRPTAGTHEFLRQRVSDLRDRQLAIIRNKSIGFVFQTFNLINRTTALDNVRVPLIYSRQTATRKPALEALDRVGLTARASHKPSELSGGERQRVAIARAIVNHPKLVLADEPTGNLDTRTGEQIMQIFHELHRAGVTVILVTHEMSVAIQAQRVIRMKDGKIIEDKPVDQDARAELLAQS
jgi:putative ABC transport system ATP-binding protein